MITPAEALAFRSPEDIAATAEHEERVDNLLRTYTGKPVRVEMEKVPPKVLIDLETAYLPLWDILKDPGGQLAGPPTWTFSARVGG